MSFLDKIGLAGKINVDELYNNFLGLERRQQQIVATAIVIVLLIIIASPVGCLSMSLGKKRDKYQEYIKMASELEGVQNQIKVKQTGFEALKKGSGSLGSDPLKQILYNVTDEIGIERQKVVPTTAKSPESDLFVESAKDVKISNISFDQTVQLLSKLVNNQGGPAVGIKKLTIQTDAKNASIMKSVSFTITMRQPKS